MKNQQEVLHTASTEMPLGDIRTLRNDFVWRVGLARDSSKTNCAVDAT